MGLGDLFGGDDGGMGGFMGKFFPSKKNAMTQFGFGGLSHLLRGNGPPMMGLGSPGNPLAQMGASGADFLGGFGMLPGMARASLLGEDPRRGGQTGMAQGALMGSLAAPFIPGGAGLAASGLSSMGNMASRQMSAPPAPMMQGRAPQMNQQMMNPQMMQLLSMLMQQRRY